MRLVIWRRRFVSFVKNRRAAASGKKERDADWAIRELLARKAQRLQGCENFADVINVAECSPPISRRRLPGGSISSTAIRGRCAASHSAAAERIRLFHPDECWAVRRGQSHPPVNGEPDIACYHLPASHTHTSLCVPMIAEGEAIGLLSFQNITAENALPAPIWS